MKIPGIENLIIFTDLDGTLLDHETYSYAPALEALDALRNRNVPLIIASSKTAAEIEPLRRELGFEHCEAIVENGSGMIFSENDQQIQSDTYHSLLEKISEIPSPYRDKFVGFSQWNAAEVSTRTGLTLEASGLAKKRQFSEPGIWQGNKEELEIFSELLAEQGIMLQQGGRFISLSFGGNKVAFMKELIEKHNEGISRRFSVALGDAPNDIAMLEAADLGIVIPNPAHHGMDRIPVGGNIIRAIQSGPAGWNESVLDILNKAGSGGQIG